MSRELEQENELLRGHLDLLIDAQMAEIEGAFAYSDGLGVEDCPYSDDNKVRYWLLGYRNREIEITNQALIVALRQALKTQIMSIEHWLDVSEVQQDNPDDWWLRFMTQDAANSFSSSPEKAKQYEALVKHAIALVHSGFITINENGQEMDNYKSEYYVRLRDAVERLYDSTN